MLIVNASSCVNCTCAFFNYKQLPNHHKVWFFVSFNILICRTNNAFWKQGGHFGSCCLFLVFTGKSRFCHWASFEKPPERFSERPQIGWVSIFRSNITNIAKLTGKLQNISLEHFSFFCLSKTTINFPKLNCAKARCCVFSELEVLGKLSFRYFFSSFENSWIRFLEFFELVETILKALKGQLN